MKMTPLSPHPPHEPYGADITVVARSVKLTVVLPTAETAARLQTFRTIGGRVPMTIAVESHRLRTDVAAKSVHRALTTIAEHGPDDVGLIVEGRLCSGPGLQIVGAGMIAQLVEKTTCNCGLIRERQSSSAGGPTTGRQKHRGA
jgi:hypothetical protein